MFGGTGFNLNQIQPYDQRTTSLAIDATKNLMTGGNIDMNYNPARTNLNQDVAEGFLFNPAWTGGLSFTGHFAAVGNPSMIVFLGLA